MKKPLNPKGDINQGKSTSNKSHQDTTSELKRHGISNSGGQLSYQTDNKQGNVNRGNQNSDVQGKKQAPKKESMHKPK